MTNFDRRPRGRNNNRRNGRRHNGPRTSQVIKLNDQGRSFNHQRPRFNGNASKLFEKYNVLAAEALSKDDKILAEHYFQHADHFARMMPPPQETVQTNGQDNIHQSESITSNNEEEVITEDSSSSNLGTEEENTVVAKSPEDN